MITADDSSGALLIVGSFKKRFPDPDFKVGRVVRAHAQTHTLTHTRTLNSMRTQRSNPQSAGGGDGGVLWQRALKWRINAETWMNTRPDGTEHKEPTH